MKENLPIIQVTPAATVRLSRKKRLKVTTLEARQWLLRHRKAIERRLADAAQDAINDALEQIMFCEWPEPAFNTSGRLAERSSPSYFHVDGWAAGPCELKTLQ